MDDRFPKILRIIVRRLEFLALPNLPLLVCGMSVLAFVGYNFFGAPLDRFIFDPYLVMQGQWWRLFPFPGIESMHSLIWFFFFVMWTYYIMGGLEAEWGPGPLTVFVILGYFCTVGASFIALQPISIWFYILENVTLAFATLFPDAEVYLWFFPVRAKWLALFPAFSLGMQFFQGGLYSKLFVLIVVIPYFVFFGSLLYGRIRTWHRIRQNRRRFDDDR